MGRTSLPASGFTLVELLVATVVFGIVLAAVGAFLTGGLNFTAAATTTADRLREVNDASGYLSDNVRRASSVIATTVGCDPVAVECVSMVVPNVTGAGGAGVIDQYVGLEYQVVPRSSVPLAQRADDSWADDAVNGVLAIVEYRAVQCGPGSASACGATAPVASVGLWSTGEGPFLVLDRVSPGSTFGAAAGSPGLIELRVQVSSFRRGDEARTPVDPVSIVVSPRNTP